MTAYDATKDKLIEDLGMIEGSNLKAELRSYDGGELKLAVFRVFEQKKGTASRQLFRIPLADVAVLGEFMMALTAQYGTGEDSIEDEG